MHAHRIGDNMLVYANNGRQTLIDELAAGHRISKFEHTNQTAMVTLEDGTEIHLTGIVRTESQWSDDESILELHWNDNGYSLRIVHDWTKEIEGIDVFIR
jgi:hypothetical protein